MVLGTGIAALALAMWRGQTSACLPKQVAQSTLPLIWARRVLRMLARFYAGSARLASTRMTSFARVGPRSATACLVGLMAVLIILPIPFGNVLPALTLMLVGLSMVFRDGAAMLVAWATALLATAFPAALGWLAFDWGSRFLALL